METGDYYLWDIHRSIENIWGFPMNLICTQFEAHRTVDTVSFFLPDIYQHISGTLFPCFSNPAPCWKILLVNCSTTRTSFLYVAGPKDRWKHEPQISFSSAQHPLSCCSKELLRNVCTSRWKWDDAPYFRRWYQWNIHEVITSSEIVTLMGINVKSGGGGHNFFIFQTAQNTVNFVHLRSCYMS